MKWIRRILLITIIGLAITGAALTFWTVRSFGTAVTKEELDGLSLSGVKRLMIVAHPDDETLWGGAHLEENPYLVVCLTNKASAVRREEFVRVVTEAGSVPLILNYPDKVAGIRSRWLLAEKRIQRDLEVLLGYQDWELIVTHNPEGEYGHIHHKKTSSLVTKVAGEKRREKLFYFGIYYTKEQMAGKNPLPDNSVSGKKLATAEVNQKKLQLLHIYKSQKKTVELFSHMMPYEDWIPAKNWEARKQERTE